MISENCKSNLKNLAGIITEDKKKNHKNEYGALMLDIDYEGWDDILDMINQEDIYDSEPGFGYEKKPHCTALFGFHKTASVSKIKELIKEKQSGPIELEVGNITHFETPDYDVVKFDVHSPGMHKINKLMRDNFSYTNDYPNYEPHMTVAYVKKGNGKKYDSKNKKIKMQSNKFIYSPSEGSKSYFTF